MVFHRGTIAKQGELCRCLSCKRGSVLILILWVLVLMGFLSGEYLAHNRGNAALAYNAWHKLKLEESIQSVVALVASGYAPNEAGSADLGGWWPLSVRDVKLWVKMNSESTKIDINKASDAAIKDQIYESLVDSWTEGADEISDAILDWRDTDDLIRTHGAEADYYAGRGFPYGPANGPFKVLT